MQLDSDIRALLKNPEAEVRDCLARRIRARFIGYRWHIENLQWQLAKASADLAAAQIARDTEDRELLELSDLLSRAEWASGPEAIDEFCRRHRPATDETKVERRQ